MFHTNAIYWNDKQLKFSDFALKTISHNQINLNLTFIINNRTKVVIR